MIYKNYKIYIYIYINFKVYNVLNQSRETNYYNMIHTYIYVYTYAKMCWRSYIFDCDLVDLYEKSTFALLRLLEEEEDAE